MPKYIVRWRHLHVVSLHVLWSALLWWVSIGGEVVQPCWAQKSDHTSKASVSPKSEFLATEAERFKIAKREYELGLLDFKAKRYREALRRFNHVYRIQPHPNLVYNMARSFEQLYEYESAATYYQRYLELNPKSSDQEQVKLTIKTMRLLAVKEKSPPPAKPVEHQSNRIFQWSGVATGGALMIGGIFLGSQALSLDQELSTFKDGDSPSEFDNTRSRRDQSAMFADVLTLSGAVLTGVSLYFMLRSVGDPSTSKIRERAHSDRDSSPFHMILSPTSLTLSGAF